MNDTSGSSGGTRRFAARIASASVASVADVVSRGALLVLVGRAAGPHELGALAAAIAVCTPFFLLAGLQLPAIVATEAVARTRLRDVLALRLLSSVVAGALSLIIGRVVLGGDDTYSVLKLFVLLRSIDAMVEGVQALSHRARKLTPIAAAQVTRAVASVLAAALMLDRGMTVFSVLGGQCVVSLTILLVFDLPVAVRLVRTGDGASSRVSSVASDGIGARLRELVRTGLPLGLVSFADTLMFSVPRLSLEQFRSLNEVGLFSAMMIPVTVGGAVATGLSFGARGQLATLFATGDVKFEAEANRVVWLTAVLGLMLVVTIVAIGGWSLKLVFGPQFETDPVSFTVLGLAGAFWYLATGFGVAITAARLFKRTLVAVSVASAATTVCCVMLASIGGVRGVAAALAIGMIVRAAMMRRLQPALGLNP